MAMYLCYGLFDRARRLMIMFLDVTFCGGPVFDHRLGDVESEDCAGMGRCQMELGESLPWGKWIAC